MTSYGGGLNDEEEKEVESHFLKIREILKDKFVAKTGGVVEAPDATAAVN